MAKGDDELVFLPLGGVGEIGMNFALYGFGPAHQREWIIVDCGVTFPGPDLPGVDLVLPDIRFIEAEKRNLRGMVITHAHEDHYGAILSLWPRLRCPVYMTPFAAGLLESKAEGERGAPDVPVTIYNAGDTFQIGPFSIEAVPVSHSIPEPVSLAIRTSLGTVVHTGDWKIDTAPALMPKTDENRFRAIGRDGVLALICDSTNAMREGEAPTEQEVGVNLRKVIEEAPGRVAITTFSSNVGRLRLVAEAARDAGRQVLVLGRSMRRVIDVASELGYLDGLPEFLSEDEFGSIPRENAVILCTGSQGEPRAALSKLARGEMRNVSLTAGDTVVYSSRMIPGNEKPILDVMNGLIEQGIKIITDSDAPIHVSGHPRRGELRQMYDWIKPRISVPVHGEAAHLHAHFALATEIGVPEVTSVRNGRMLRLAPGPAEIIDEAPHGRIYKDSKLIGDFEELGIGDRRKLSFSGHVAVAVVLDDKFNIVGDPDLEAFGLPEEDAEGELLEDVLYDAAISAVENIPRARRKDIELVREAVRRAVRSAANESWGKKPVTTVFVMTV
jgi:ribonuclease J